MFVQYHRMWVMYIVYLYMTYRYYNLALAVTHSIRFHNVQYFGRIQVTKRAKM